MQVCSEAEAKLQAFLSGGEQAQATPDRAASRTPRLLTSQDKHGSLAPTGTTNSVKAPSKTAAQRAGGPVSAPPRGQAAAAYHSQQHFVDVLRQLEARKAELQQQVGQHTATALPTASPHASAPTPCGGGAAKGSGQGVPATDTTGKRSADAGSAPDKGQKRQKLV